MHLLRLSVIVLLPGQDDLLYETLTVHETLYYAAMLRLPSTMTAGQKEERVLNVIHTLGLDKCRDTIVGARALLLGWCRMSWDGCSLDNTCWTLWAGRVLPVGLILCCMRMQAASSGGASAAASASA